MTLRIHLDTDLGGDIDDLCALGWRAGVEIQELPLAVEEQAGWLTLRIDPAGTPMRVVTKINGTQFDDFWLQTVTHLTLDT